MKNKKLVNNIRKEYWEEICPVCGYSGPPYAQSLIVGSKVKVKLSCPECELTVTYKMPRVQHRNNSNENPRLLNLIPSIFNSY